LIAHAGAWSRIGRVVKLPPNMSVKVKVKKESVDVALVVTTS